MIQEATNHRQVEPTVAVAEAFKYTSVQASHKMGLINGKTARVGAPKDLGK